MSQLQAVVSLGFFSSVLTSVLVLISFDNDLCCFITIVLLTCAARFVVHPRKT